MARRRSRPPAKPTGEPAYTVGPFTAASDPQASPPWRVYARGKLHAVLHSRRPRADAERLAAALNQFEGIPTQQLKEAVITRLWLALKQVTDIAEGRPAPRRGGDPEAHKAYWLGYARRLLTETNQPPPRAEPGYEDEAPQPANT